ncbi:MAG: hypothetical protein QF893_17995 [Alphaproteobacteria bacterium]|jgi:hypothetical protein|nr:hypothetical protein [Alphaproteobacteria bacterium]
MRPSGIPYGLMFHHCHGPGHAPAQGLLTAEAFADMLDFVGRDRILPAEEWQRRALEGRLDHCLVAGEMQRARAA